MPSPWGVRPWPFDAPPAARGGAGGKKIMSVTNTRRSRGPAARSGSGSAAPTWPWSRPSTPITCCNGLGTFEETRPRSRSARAPRGRARPGPALSGGRAGRPVVGYSYANLYRLRPAYRYTVEDSVYVAQGMGGQGIGTALLGELIARCETGPWRRCSRSSAIPATPAPSPCTAGWLCAGRRPAPPWAQARPVGGHRAMQRPLARL
jgi:GNAT superfamily N-acetyltransferase